MSDRRHTPRPTLPEGYQYGDASFVNMDAAIAYRQTTPHPEESVFVVERDARLRDCRAQPLDHVLLAIRNAIYPPHTWRAPRENAAAQLTRQQAPQMWTCGDEGRHWFEGRAENHTPTDRCGLGRKSTRK